MRKTFPIINFCQQSGDSHAFLLGKVDKFDNLAGVKHLTISMSADNHMNYNPSKNNINDMNKYYYLQDMVNNVNTFIFLVK